VDLGGIGSESVISENLGFSSKFMGSHFHLNVTFLRKLGHFIDSSRNGGLCDALGSSPRRSFLALEIAYFDGFGQGGSET